ncbi:hypothetical protein ACWCWD_16615 [Streptomyces sp. NPDC001493]
MESIIWPRVWLGFVLPGLLALSCWGCGTTARAETDKNPVARADSRMYAGCTHGRSLEKVEKVYGLAIPDAVANLRFCEQEDWSGSAGEIQFDASRKEWGEFLADSGQPGIELVKITPSSEGRKWQKVPKGVKVGYGSYDNVVDGCENSVYIYVQELHTDALRVFLKLVCAS